MNVTVLLFAAARDAASGKPELTLDLPAGATAEDALKALVARYSQLETWEAHVRIAVNEEYVAGSTALREGDVVAVIPPVSGG